MYHFFYKGLAMFIRKKKNKSGTISIMLVVGERKKTGKKYPYPRIIKNFGTSDNSSEIENLIQQAEEYKKHLQLTSPKATTLKITSDRDIKFCDSFNVGFLDVYGKIFNDIFSEINLKSHELKKLRDVIVMRIANPASKRKTAMISREYGIECNVDSIYKLMDQLHEDTIKQTKKIIYDHSIALLSEKKETVDVMFYDLTTIYFENNSQDDLRNFGFSKDGKFQHVQIMLAVIVTKHGLPINYEEFPGNCFEGHTLIPVIDKIKSRYNIGKIILVADAALMNKINLSALTENDINYVIAARIKNEKKEIQSVVLDKNNYHEISKNQQNDFIQSKLIPLPSDNTLIAFYSSKRARKDEYNRKKDIERIEKYINSTAKSKLTGRLKKPYVKIKSCKIEIDLEKLEQEKRFDGFFGIKTNLKNINPKEILDAYRGLWQVEQTFRIAKSNLEIRPVFHYNIDRIKAHFLICYMSLALIRYIEFQLRENNLNYTVDQLHLLLNQIRITKIQHADDKIYDLLETVPQDAKIIYDALKIKWHKKFSHEHIMLK
jgi:transposase